LKPMMPDLKSSNCSLLDATKPIELSGAVSVRAALVHIAQ
jgi:hypothetical protein